MTSHVSSIALKALTQSWGEESAVSLYLKRCQVNTPERLVSSVWQHVEKYRTSIGKVLDFGAGDGRFAKYGKYDSYHGYEIDGTLARTLPHNAHIVNACAFSTHISDADVCIGNPPFVRNQDLPNGWRIEATELLQEKTGVRLSGLANAWQYFFLLALVSLKTDGLAALIIPYEWVSRPSARQIRDYIYQNSWNVDVFRLVDETFDSVLTTTSITIIDKSERRRRWRYYEELANGKYKPLASASGAAEGVLRYMQPSIVTQQLPVVRRGLSPGTQKVLVLTEGERVSNGLLIQHDVVRCVTSLRHIPHELCNLDKAAFERFFVSRGQKCWLIRSDTEPSKRLAGYLDATPSTKHQTKTCLERALWWKFKFPEVPKALVSQTFKHHFPKVVKNIVGARAVGGVSGIYGLAEEQINELLDGFSEMDISDRVVSYANGLHKVEINQLNGILYDRFQSMITRDNHEKA